MELGRGRSSTLGHRPTSMLHYAIRAGAAVTRASGLWRLASTAAQKFDISEVELRCVRLPEALDGFTVLHLSDLHFESLPDLACSVAARIREVKADIAVITGDFQVDEDKTHPERALDLIRPVIEAIRVRHGIYAVLGNHDSWKIVEPLERHGVRMLINEHVALEAGAAKIHLSGIDDTHAFYTDDAVRIVQDRTDDFRILLAHTPEIADLAAAAGCDLYLTGHTHGGQICLPNGRPLIAGLDRNRDLASGHWRIGAMHGYTSRGLGTASLPLRINCPAEIGVLRLRAAVG
jgi:uncharacterized protein